MAIVAVMIAADCGLLLDGKTSASDRLVSGSVIIALISAATVQLGDIGLLMGTYLFPMEP